MRKALLAASVLALTTLSPIAHAHLEGDLILRAGAVTVDPREDSQEIRHQDLGALPHSKATVDSETQLGLNFVYMFSDHFGAELLAATRFEHEIKATGGMVKDAGLDGRLGDTQHLPPTLSLVYFPLDDRYNFQPYVGAGINYTVFFQDKLGSSAKKKGFRGLNLDNSWGMAWEVGFDYMITDQILINAQARYIDIDTEAVTHLAGRRVKVDVDLDPFVYMVGLGYRF